MAGCTSAEKGVEVRPWQGLVCEGTIQRHITSIQRETSRAFREPEGFTGTELAQCSSLWRRNAGPAPGVPFSFQRQVVGVSPAQCACGVLAASELAPERWTHMAVSRQVALSPLFRQVRRGPGGHFWKSFYFSLSLFFLAALHGLWDLSSPTRDRTRAPCIGSVES